MSRGKKPKIAPYLLCGEEASGTFTMIPPDLFESERFQQLTYGAQLFYILIAVHSNTRIQKECLHEALTEYRDLGIAVIENKKSDRYGKPLTDEDINFQTWGDIKHGTFSRLFVFPAKHLAMYGYTPQQASALKKQLIEKEFIAVKYGGKGKHSAWDRNVTIYRFCYDK